MATFQQVDPAKLRLHLGFLPFRANSSTLTLGPGQRWMQQISQISHKSDRNKTLVFCTSYCSTHNQWDQRYRRWLDAIRASNLEFSKILIIDDCSESLPGWRDIQIIEEDSDLNMSESVALFRFKKHLGRHSDRNFPGWYRSFSFAFFFAQAHGFKKIIHIESDAFLISSRIVEYINKLDDGWVALWCDSHKFPETAIQIVAGKAMALFGSTVSRPYSEFVGKFPEEEFPFTHIERSFVGDRYGEYTNIVPRFADFCTQTVENAPSDYFWWLTEKAPIGIWRMLTYPMHFAKKPLRFVRKPLPDKWAAVKATINIGQRIRR